MSLLGFADDKVLLENETSTVLDWNKLKKKVGLRIDRVHGIFSRHENWKQVEKL